MARERRTTPMAVIAISLLALSACGSSPSVSNASISPAGNDTLSLKNVTGVHRVGQITGAEGPGKTTKYATGYTDLGSMFEHKGKVYFTFGDTFADRDPGATGGGGTDWRSNVMGWTTDTDPSDGITLNGMITDTHGAAKELLVSKKVDGDEMTVIPTHGFSANGNMYLHYMSVRHWGEPGEWEVNQAGLAKSTDDGHTWTKLKQPRWGGDSGFVQVSPHHVDEDGVDTLYFWGITHGRFGGVSLAKVPAAKVEDPDAWRYFAGTQDGKPQWADGPADAKQVLDDNVGELSVTYNKYLGNWIMTYLAEGRGIVLREGRSPWGPWGKAHVLVSKDDAPGPYAPFMLDRYTADGGRTIYFTLSIWEPYNVFWYQARLNRS